VLAAGEDVDGAAAAHALAAARLAEREAGVAHGVEEGRRAARSIRRRSVRLGHGQADGPLAVAKWISAIVDCNAEHDSLGPRGMRTRRVVEKPKGQLGTSWPFGQ
jgi:hypothetical protein